MGTKNDQVRRAKGVGDWRSSVDPAKKGGEWEWRTCDQRSTHHQNNEKIKESRGTKRRGMGSCMDPILKKERTGVTDKR